MTHLLTHHLYDVIAGVVFICSILGTILPPFEVFNFAPRFQLAYRIFLAFVAQFGALNLRGTVMRLYPSYQRRGDPKEKS